MQHPITYIKFLFRIFCILLLFAMVGLFLRVHGENSRVFFANQIWEMVESSHGKHQLASVITHVDGPELYLDGVRITKNNTNIEYSPVVNDRGDFAYALAEKDWRKSKVMLNGKAILDNGTFCDHLTLTNECLLFSSFSMKDKESMLYVYRLGEGKCEVLATFKGACIAGLRLVKEKHAAVLVEKYEQARKWFLYDVYMQKGGVTLALESDDKMLFARGKDDAPCVDRIPLVGNGNTHRLLNSWYWFYHYQHGEPFSYGNDFCGRLSWNESYRMQGILALYRKTGDAELKETLCSTTKNILAARNGENRIADDGFNPTFLWASKLYSNDWQPVSLMVNNGMILEALLSAANEGVLDNETAGEVYDTAKNAFAYYETFYDGKGQYAFQPGGPFWADGVVLPWNQQNAMASAYLELWKGTGKEKYLRRAEEMLSAFRAEWVEENGKVRWRYWPNIFYAGWDKESGISKNTPTRKPMELSKVAFEDISHAGLSAGVVAKYFLMCPRGFISKADMEKIQRNMESWCFEEGFSVSLGGGDISYSYVPSSGWGYFRNPHLDQYVCYGRPLTEVNWDSQAFLGLVARHYEPGVENTFLTVERYAYNSDGEWEKAETFSLYEKDIKEFVKESYGEKKNRSWKEFSWDQRIMVILKNLFSWVMP